MSESPVRPDSVAKAFDTAMLSIYQRALAEAGYSATRFLQMLNGHGGVETANRLLPQMSDGFTELWARNRLDLTMEALIILARWRPLLTDDQLKIAESRLREARYQGPWS